MNRSEVRDSLRGWAVDLLIATAFGLFLGAIGPFGSYFNGPLWERVSFQVACAWMAVLLLGSGIRLILRLQLRPAASWTAVVLMTAALMAPLALVFSELAHAIWPFLRWRLDYQDWYLQGLLTAEPAALALTLINRRRRRRRALRTEAGATAPSRVGLLGAAPSEVLCLQMEDHYVRVHTARGSRLVLATLGQAIAALGGAEGPQSHRSWWVAKKAVVGAERHGRNLRLRLSNGLLAPVARSAVPVVRAAGWMGEGV